jgi:S-formylglutathione hydrolase FrmB
LKRNSHPSPSLAGVRLLTLLLASVSVCAAIRADAQETTAASENAAAGAAAAAAAGAAVHKGGKIQWIKVHGASLEGNLEGDSPDRDVAVYLPPSYDEAAGRRYPVVYLLHGYGRTAEKWTPFIGLPGAFDRDIAAGTAREMILVIPDANTLYGGSMYSSSPTTGDWESYITRDLVAYIDSHYRTLATRESRGLGGHSMGGYGVWRIAMKHPEVYSSIYGLSACCLMNDPRPRPPAPASGTQRQAAPPNFGERGGHPINVPYGEAAAWSPNPTKPPLYFDEPVVDGQVQPAIAAKWHANSPLAMLDQYVPNMKRYRAIAMDVGLQDTLLRSNKEFEESLTRLGIEHTFETYEGDHSNHLADRIEQKVLPFFSKHLSFGEAGK